MSNACNNLGERKEGNGKEREKVETRKRKREREKGGFECKERGGKWPARVRSE